MTSDSAQPPRDRATAETSAPDPSSEGEASASNREGAEDTAPGREKAAGAGGGRLRSQAKAAQWAVRLAYLTVFVVNVQCALGFALHPEGYVGAYQLQGAGASGIAAVQGVGIAFLMWNCTYPAVIANPRRFLPLAVVVLVQQVVGLVGETAIFFQLPAGYDVLAASVRQFIAFDAFGLVIMGLSFAWMAATRRKAHAEAGDG